MASFHRKLPQLEKLIGCTEPDGSTWFADLLSLWRPAGQPAGDHGLRLAIRNGYMNFYRCGQSVARVCFGRAGAPRAEVHVKYVLGEEETEQHYVCLAGFSVTRKGAKIGNYDGIDTLRTWVQRAEGHAGKEKRFVDRVLANNPEVVDLEMGLPAFAPPGANRTAPRMDVVALEPVADGYRLVFWEAKLMADGRLRAREGEAEVVTQLREYTEWLEYGDHVQVVKEAYRRNCALLLCLHKWAGETGEGAGGLGAGISHVAQFGLDSVDVVPRLLIEDRDRSTSWAAHARKLGDIPVHYVRDEPADLALPVRS